MLPLGANLEPRPENQTVELDCGLVFWRLEDIVAYLRIPWLLKDGSVFRHSGDSSMDKRSLVTEVGSWRVSLLMPGELGLSHTVPLGGGYI